MGSDPTDNRDCCLASATVPGGRPSPAATLSLSYPADPSVVRASEWATLRALLSAPTTACVYVSGSPGVGKSLTLSALLRELAGDTIWLSCASFQSAVQLPRAVYAALHDGGKAASTASDPWAAVAETASGPGPRVLLVLDELDLLGSRDGAAKLPAVFGWARLPGSRVSVIGISNFLALPDALAGRAQALELDVVAFQPYTAPQLTALVCNRLADAQEALEAGRCKGDSGSNRFAPDACAPLGAPAISLAAKRIAASSGDARAMLDVCREAVRQLETQGCPATGPERRAAALHCMASILSRAGGGSLAVDTIRALPLQQQLVLCTVARAEQRASSITTLDSAAFSLASLYDVYKRMLYKIGMQNASLQFSEFADLCCDVLAASHGLVNVECGKLKSSALRPKSSKSNSLQDRVRKVAKIGPTRFGQSRVTQRTKLVRLKVPIEDVQAGVSDRALLPLLVGKEE